MSLIVYKIFSLGKLYKTGYHELLHVHSNDGFTRTEDASAGPSGLSLASGVVVVGW